MLFLIIFVSQKSLFDLVFYRFWRGFFKQKENIVESQLILDLYI